jgi:3-deoxy-D-arabino-heptulosonate 7-phosphate (DAHP) synthase class II
MSAASIVLLVLVKMIAANLKAPRQSMMERMSRARLVRWRGSLMNGGLGLEACVA